ncbi:SusC/RagA family TonB-linked outer membrane protein [Sphingobacterium sp. SYP-B4668]|uniref:SusC/RagA family TonB-linked outer membrane protein n=1 Tax=Sphingobacterium sp. SYP-B4668 TaxID=2996035 RepID=UPI0022DE8CEA|nr:TonB-dependent receptor [Sphingobacterium sp. SYP-B4668]
MNFLKRSMLIGGGLLLAYSAYPQPMLSVQVHNGTLKQVFQEIEKQSPYVFFYPTGTELEQKRVNIAAKNKRLPEVLGELSDEANFSYSIEGSQVLIAQQASRRAATPGARLQQRKVTGVVRDEQGGAVAGATVTASKSNTVTQTDDDGRYEIMLGQADDQLVFSKVGYVAREEKFTSGSNILDVVLTPIVNELDELVIVGFGQQRRISNIGAQSNLKMTDIKTPSSSLSTVLAGRLAGVVAVQRTGEPGRDAADIWIRGIATPNASRPLVLVDGVERSFNDIDPEDVESLTVLKDASATAVYGVRGANGVIIVKTKPGRIGKPVVSVDYYETITQFTQRAELIDGLDYMATANEALANGNQQPKYSEQYIERTRANFDPYLYPNVDWLSSIFNDFGQNRRANVNVRGGSESANYYASVSYFNEKGLMRTESLESYNSKMSFNRYNFTTNLNLKVTPTTTVEIGAQGYLGEGNYPAISSSSIYSASMEITPVDYPRMFFVDGKAYVPGINPNGGFRNPYADATRRGYSNQTRNQVYSNLRVNQDLGMLTEGLKLSGMFAYDVYNSVNIMQSKRESTYYFANRDVPYDMDGRPILVQTYAGSDVLGFEQRSDGNEKKTYLEASLNYDRAFGKHRVGGLFLYNQQSRLLYPVGSLEDAIPYRTLGVAGRAIYSYDDRYFAEFNVGYNGSENFTPERRFGVFPAFGIGWVPSNERFWQPLASTINFLKLRYTNGIIGNSNVSGRRFMYLEQMQFDNGFGYNWGSAGGRRPGVKVNNNAVNIGWEESHKQDLGIEFKVLNSSLSVIVDLFKERRSGILLQRNESIPSFLGYMSDPYGNVGVIENKGIDGTLEYNKRINEDWQIYLRGNLTFNKDKWVDSDQPDQRYAWMNKRGTNVNARRGYEAAGLYTQDEILDIQRYESLSAVDKEGVNRPFPTQFGEVKAGDIKYKDQNGDGVIDAYDQVYIGRGDVPRMVYGFGINTTYKRLSLGVLFQGIEGADRMLQGTSIHPFVGDGGGGNLFSNITDRWTADNPRQDAFYPRLAYGSDQTSNINNFQSSTWWQKDVSFLRLKTLQVNYNLPKEWFARVGIDKVDLYLMGTNLLTWSKFKLWDPELNTNNGTSYPNMKSYSFGINFSF